MKRLLTLSLLVFQCLFFNAYLSPCFSDQQLQSEDKYIKGKVAHVDFVGSTISVKFIQANGNNDEITFSAAQRTQITKSDLLISILELREGDEVIVKYHNDPGSFASLKADYINVKP